MSLISNKPFTIDRVIRTAIWVAVIWGFFKALQYLSDILIPFAIAALLAYLINPLVIFLQEKVRIRNRVISVLLSLIVVFGLLTGLALILIPLVTKDISHMAEIVKGLAQDPQLDMKAQEYIPPSVWKEVNTLLNSDFFHTDKFANMAIDAAKKVLPNVIGLFNNVLHLLLSIMGLAIILLYLVFILLDYNKIMVQWTDLLPEQYHHTIKDVSTNFKKAMGSYFRAQTVIASLVGILFAIGFSIIDLPMAVVFGLFVGLLNLVPYLQNIAFIPAALFALVHSLDTGENFWIMMLLVLAIFAIVQLIQDALLTPKIMGDAIGLNPAVMLLSLSIWGKLLGLLGLIIALPMTFLIWSYYSRFLAKSDNHPETPLIPTPRPKE
ncbi:AI-2E family transporter [Microscilla marina]|uniref:Putative permease n=1 Tax=Microscilla marina ATCC 23134 TaxID=313606 RepID=A1ZSF8_MICM2|nr:AI-2E family transporter [Microscilla marina]EAY26706.1 putative permease [Microscilla marina ATCC 23134]